MNKIAPYIIVLSAIAIIQDGVCQTTQMSGEGGRLNWKNKIKIADKLFKEQYFYDAAHYYEDAHKEQPNDVDISYKLAEAYYYSRDYKNAETLYKQVAENTYKDIYFYFPFVRYKHAQTLKMNGAYQEAKQEFENFIDGYRAEDFRIYKQIVDNEIAGCDFASEAIKKPIAVKIEHMKSVNAAYTESAPFPLGDNLLFYSSLVSDTVIVLEKDKSIISKFRIYQSKKINGQWSKGELLPEIINSSNANVANGTFSPDLKKFYFTQCEENEKGNLICAIYRANYENGLWSEREKLNELINIPGYTSTQPTIAPYKKGQQILYFISDMPGGMGGLDLWYVVLDKEGAFSIRNKPVNAGKKINTLSDELTPYYDHKSNILYFSSNGHPGMGGYDIFMTEGELRKWSEPVNLGYPINSSVDDMYIVTDSRGGYFVSNRRGTIALKSETCCDDIFRFDWLKMITIAVDGFAYDEDVPGYIPLDEIKTQLFLIDKDSSEVLVAELAPGKGITNSFFTLKQDRNYKIVKSAKGYFSNYETITTEGITKSDTLHVKIPLKKLEFNKSIVLKDIYYDFDKATLRPASENTLAMLTMLLRENPEIIVELSAHTDSKGDDLYNEKLSQRRAESVVKYLKNEGIIKDRLVAKGYGESKPIAPNTLSDGTDNPEGRQFNRRTEIKVIGKLDVVIEKEAVDIEDIMEEE